MKKRYFFAAMLTLLLLLAGCREKAEPPIDYTALFEDHASRLRSDITEAQLIAVSDDFALVHYSGTGPSLVLYQVEVSQGKAYPVASATGELAISGCISINHLEVDGKHHYFGMLNDTHFNPMDCSVTDTNQGELSMEPMVVPNPEVDTGSVVSKNVKAGSGFYFTLPDQLVNFEGVGVDGKVFLNLQTWLDQGYQIQETELVPIS